ncbi:MAG: uracil-DNA glycosylase family protein [Pseudomonadota bacterium]
MSDTREKLCAVVNDIRACRNCVDDFGFEPRPVFQLEVGPSQRVPPIAIFGQAPGNQVHLKGRPFDDPSGVRLRQWLGVDEAAFYDPRNFAILPMAFCFPGYDAKGGDRPPPKICATLWREKLLACLPEIKLKLLVGSYAQRWHLGGEAQKTLTATVENWRAYGPDTIPLPHPSWRNNIWLKNHPWFEEDLLPVLRRRVRTILSQ